MYVSRKGVRKAVCIGGRGGEGRGGEAENYCDTWTEGNGGT